MSLINKKSAAQGGEGNEMTGAGLGESLDFLNTENHIFLNKLNYICKNYDTNFKDVSATNNQSTLANSLLMCSGETHESASGGLGAPLS